MQLRRNVEWIGLGYGLLGVFAFSLTLPVTRVAVGVFGATFVGLGRAFVAALPAALFLWARRSTWPTAAQWRRLLLVATGVIFGFPLLSAWAMGRVAASHGGVVLGLLPLATAGVAALRGGERPSLGFWLASLVGSVAVIVYALGTGAGRLELADLALVGAVLLAALGYAEGGRLAAELGALQVISWALVLSAPVTGVAAGLALWQHGLLGATGLVWGAFAYLALISQFLGFAAWYGGMALGGVARVSQLQLLQPFFTLLASAWLLQERMTWGTGISAVVVLAAVAFGRKAVVVRSPRAG